MFSKFSLLAISLLASPLIYQISANSDPSTGHNWDRRPTQNWLDMYTPKVKTKAIQVSECAMNTRLHFPDIQVFAYFLVNHKIDHYHGCPYGDCHAYDVFPQFNETEAAYTDNHIFFWHNVGGEDGPGVKPISNPQTGVYGYEQSLSGKYIDGVAPATNEQKFHDSKYPPYKRISSTWHLWSEKDRQPTHSKTGASHPKCGRPCDPNKDPGEKAGSPDHYIPSPASDYSPPFDWVAKNSTEKKCAGNPPTTKNRGSQHGTAPPKASPTHSAKNPNGTLSKPQGRSKKGSCYELCQCIKTCKLCPEDCDEKCRNSHKSCNNPTCDD
ncbi:secreted protein [Phakopsora pachyrhizi]|nr:secreted protein [Phakopsora pachyrhizi]